MRKSKKPENSAANRILRSSLEALEKWEQSGMNLDDLLDAAPEDIRRSVSSILFIFFRKKALVESLIAKHSSKVKPRLRRLLSITIVQILFQDAIRSEFAVDIAVTYASARFGKRPAGFVNAVLRKVVLEDAANLHNDFSPDSGNNMPKSLYRRWVANFGDNSASACAKLLESKVPMTFRAVDDISDEELKTVSATPLALPEWADGFRFYECHAPAKLLATNWLSKGAVYIQDPATLIAPLLCKPAVSNPLTLDGCAAPGGKSLLLSTLLPKAQIIASDRSFRRQKRTLENFNCFDCSANMLVASVLNPPFREESFDLILLDVPCSNTGVFRKRPDVVWRFSTKKLKELVQLQLQMLNSASHLLKKGGQLVYSTCSIEPEEGSVIIEKFTNQNRNFKLDKSLTLLPSNSHDGCFAASLFKA